MPQMTKFSQSIIRINIYLVFMAAPFFLKAQEGKETKVFTQGKITYERKIYLQKNLEDSGMADNSWYERMRDKIPKVIRTQFDLYFDPSKSHFVVSPEQDESGNKLPPWLEGYSATNEVYADFEKDKLVIQKTSMGKDFLIIDSIPDMEWKITDEFKTIAGFACRKATTIVMDSLYIIAFYTDAIYPPTGPEHFYNLPGTIMGIAIPRLHTSYMATRFESVSVSEENFDQPKKGKNTNLKDLQQNLYEIGEGFKAGMGERMAWGIWL